MKGEDFNLNNTIERREAVTQRIVTHLRVGTKELSIWLLCAWLSIDELESIAKFWDERLSPEEKSAIESLIQVGDIVRRKDGRELRSGCCAYGAAIVISREPFILVSQDADMMWSSTVDARDFFTTGKATPEQLVRAAQRLKA